MRLEYFQKQTSDAFRPFTPYLEVSYWNLPDSRETFHLERFYPLPMSEYLFHHDIDRLRTNRQHLPFCSSVGDRPPFCPLDRNLPSGFNPLPFLRVQAIPTLESLQYRPVFSVQGIKKPPPGGPEEEFEVDALSSGIFGFIFSTRPFDIDTCRCQL